ncbi:MAG: CysB family HTH-type transcriptional regulator [Burkholderiaceae bacterium]
MNLHQLRIVRETARRKFNLTEVAAALYLAQSGVSKHIKELEDELGVELFVRRGKRLLGLTEPGKELLVVAERMLHDAQNIRQLADQFSQKDAGRLDIATTHTQARYALPEVVRRFRSEFPKVHLALQQASPREIVRMLNEGEADIGIATESVARESTLVAFPFHHWRHAAVVPKGHPLTRLDHVTLADLAEHPLITYQPEYTGRTKIDAAFAREGLAPDIVMSAVDADVIKTYVELGLGVGIVAALAVAPGRASDLVVLPVGDLFELNTTWIAVRRGHYLRGFGYRFIELCSAELTEDTVRRSLNPERDPSLP